jgi:hypothetical protein
MKLSSFLVAALILALPTLVRADANPSYERDAKPILETQPGLVQYIHAHFVVKETGAACVPGAPGQAPQPPFIFSAKPRGSDGAFYLRLLIQPGPAGHVLKVADIRRLPPGAPVVAPVPTQEETASAPLAPAPSSAPAIIGSSAPPVDAAPTVPPVTTSSQPTADTPSGPVRD